MMVLHHSERSAQRQPLARRMEYSPNRITLPDTAMCCRVGVEYITMTAPATLVRTSRSKSATASVPYPATAHRTARYSSCRSQTKRMLLVRVRQPPLQPTRGVDV